MFICKKDKLDVSSVKADKTKNRVGHKNDINPFPNV